MIADLARDGAPGGACKLDTSALKGIAAQRLVDRVRAGIQTRQQPHHDVIGRHADLKADIVVTGLPTQGEPVCDAFLDLVQPQLIIVADDEFPAFERAKPQLCERLARRQVPVIYTRFAGAVTITFGRDYWQLRTIKGTQLQGKPVL